MTFYDTEYIFYISPLNLESSRVVYSECARYEAQIDWEDPDSQVPGYGVQQSNRFGRGNPGVSPPLLLGSG